MEKKRKTAKEILYEHAEKNKDGFMSGQVKWIVEAMEEYGEQEFGEGYGQAEDMAIPEFHKYQDHVKDLQQQIRENR